jgi:hypothetical protein
MTAGLANLPPDTAPDQTIQQVRLPPPRYFQKSMEIEPEHTLHRTAPSATQPSRQPILFNLPK